MPVLEIAVRKLPETVPFRELHVVSPDEDCPRIRKALGSKVRVIPENEFIPGMNLAALRELPVAGFPKMAGWYFQQLLKLQFAFCETEDDYYLIWDADTVPLRPMRFFDSKGKMLLTKATEHHPAYFETYRKLLGTDPRREFSFIAQHMLVQKSIAREMLAHIETRLEGNGNWAWKIMRALPPKGENLFSEYETYGHYVKNYRPDRVNFVDRSWLREPAQYAGEAVPTEKVLQELSRKYDFAAFERASRGWRRLANKLVGGLRQRWHR